MKFWDLSFWYDGLSRMEAPFRWHIVFQKHYKILLDKTKMRYFSPVLMNTRINITEKDHINDRRTSHDYAQTGPLNIYSLLLQFLRFFILFLTRHTWAINNSFFKLTLPTFWHTYSFGTQWIFNRLCKSKMGWIKQIIHFNLTPFSINTIQWTWHFNRTFHFNTLESNFIVAFINVSFISINLISVF